MVVAVTRPLSISQVLTDALQKYRRSESDRTVDEMRHLHAIIVTRSNEIKQADNANLLAAKLLGEKLSAEKEKGGHGNWEDWVEDNLNFLPRQASNYMRIAREWDRLMKSETPVTGLRAALKFLRETKERHDDGSTRVDRGGRKSRKKTRPKAGRQALRLEFDCSDETERQEIDGLIASAISHLGDPRIPVTKVLKVALRALVERGGENG